MSTIALVCGGRDYLNADRVCCALDHLAPSLIINGDCGGADRLAQAWAHKTGTHLVNVPALFDARGKKAGPQRNALMLKMLLMMQNNGAGPLAIVVAFPGGRGTADMVRRARAENVEVVEVADDE